MKKILFLIVTLSSFNFFAQDQLNVGINGGLSVGDTKLKSDYGFGGQVNYLFDVFSDDFVLGPSIGVSVFPGKKIEDVTIDTGMFIPVSGAFRFHSVDDKFYVGVDLGYALGLGDYEGGFHIKPQVGYLISDSLKLNAFYSGIRKAESIGYYGLGLSYDVFGAQNGSYYY